MTNRKLQFSEYYESKMKLKNAGEDAPRFYVNYEVTKYCKIPLLENIDNTEKEYVPLKPRDSIKILWETCDLEKSIPKYISIFDEFDDERRYYFSWNLSKINKWLETTTNKK